MRTIEKVWDWLVWSSADPEKLSLTVKGVLAGIGTLITVVIGVANVHLPEGAPALLTQIVDATVLAVQAIAGAVSALAAVYGLARKLLITFKGWHWAFNPADYKPITGPVVDPSVK